MEFSLLAWLGGLAGTVIAVAIYVPAIRVVEQRLRAQNGPKSGQAMPDQRAAFEEKLSIMRRIILGIDIAVLATLGYWIGSAVGAAGSHSHF
jgi:hypothetical protein